MNEPRQKSQNQVQYLPPAGPAFFRAALRSAISGMRGVLDAEIMVRQARDTREKQIALTNYRNRLIENKEAQTLLQQAQQALSEKKYAQELLEAEEDPEPTALPNEADVANPNKAMVKPTPVQPRLLLMERIDQAARRLWGQRKNFDSYDAFENYARTQLNLNPNLFALEERWKVMKLLEEYREQNKTTRPSK